MIDKAGIHIHVSTHDLDIVATYFGKCLGCEPFHRFDESHFFGLTQLFRERTGSCLECDRTRVTQGIDGMAHTINQARMVARFFM